MDWKAKAERLFFTNHMTVARIAEELGKSRKAVSDHLELCADYRDERERRKAENANRRKDYQREWDRTNRPGRKPAASFNDEGARLKAEHDEAAKILSYERIYPGAI
ncbi:MAG: transcriptional regulator [Defluviitaleaceae bacterium]|nr:transcriptional regulator [Defluviitaleaceae bacterium]